MVEIGTSLNGGAITYAHSYQIGANSNGDIADAIINSNAVTSGDTVEIYLRATGDHNNTEIWHRGDLSLSTVLTRHLANGTHEDLVGRDAADAHPQSAVTGLEQAIIDASRVNINLMAVSGNISVNQTRAQYYHVTAAAVAVSVIAGLQEGEQFTVLCLADTTINVDASYTTVNLPTTKVLQPFEAHSSITITCIDATTLDISGDLADA